VEHGITPFVPKADTSANTARGLYGKSQFKYDAAKDVYVCPAGQELTYRFDTYELGREIKYYRTNRCKTCALKTPLHAEQGQPHHHPRGQRAPDGSDGPADAGPAGKVQAAKDPGRASFRHHQALVWLHYTHFLLKGLPKVQGEWSLTTLAYNLKRALNLVSFEKLMAAVA
jgi:hypothetical protein